MTDCVAPDAAVPDVELPVSAELMLRLHGLACIRCGTVSGPLDSAGHAYTMTATGGRLGWSVVACREHRAAA